MVVVLLVLVALVLLNSLNAQKSPLEKIEQLTRQHQGVLLFVKSGTERDQEFLTALSRVKPALAGKAGVVIVSGREGGKLLGDKNWPALVVFDAHGQQLYQFTGQLDQEILEQLVSQLASHHH
ncbi:MAG TPA: hypothetical protein PK644_09755 [bacterium]|nr:hypothetical protein [bacterium]